MTARVDRSWHGVWIRYPARGWKRPRNAYFFVDEIVGPQTALLGDSRSAMKIIRVVYVIS